MRSLLRTRLNPGEFTAALAARLARALPAPPYVPGPLRLALLHLDAPYMLNVSNAYAAYQRTALDLDELLDTAVAAICHRLAHLHDPATWDEARRTVRPWLLPAGDPDALVCPTFGTLGDLTLSYRFVRPVTGTEAYVTPAAWGIAPETLHARALANVRVGGNLPSFLPVADAPTVLRLAPRDRDAASRLLLPEVRDAIIRRIGGPAAVLPAARAAVFVAPVNLFGEPPATFHRLPAVRAALAGADALSATPFVIAADDALVRR